MGFRFITFLGALATSPLCAAEESFDWLFDIPSAPSQVNFNIGQDEASNRDVQLSVDLRGPDDLRIIAGWDRYFSADNDIDTSTKSYRLGLGTDPLARWSMQVEGEHWGRENAIDIDTARAFAYYSKSNWRINLQAALRAIELTTQRENNTGSLAFNDTVGGIGLSYQGWQNISITIGTLRHRYSHEVDRLDNFNLVTLLGLSDETVVLSSSLESRRDYVNIAIPISDFDFFLQWAKSLSAVDDTTTNAIDAAMVYSFDEWSVSLRGGQQRWANSSDTTRYVNSGISFRW